MRRPSGLPALRRDHPLFRVMTKAKPLPPLELVKQLLDYDPVTGCLRWRAGSQREAGNKYRVGNTAYRRIMIGGKNYYAHRLVYLMQTQADPLDLHIDHIDGNGLNNSWRNIRVATHAENIWNSRRAASNTSGYKGVSKIKRCNQARWLAQIVVNGKQKYLGRFPTAELAHAAYCKAAAELHGDFARAA